MMDGPRKGLEGALLHNRRLAHFPAIFLRREVVRMGRKLVRFLVCLLGTLAVLAYMAPNAC